jgi:hypothetical protein
LETRIRPLIPVKSKSEVTNSSGSLHRKLPLKTGIEDGKGKTGASEGYLLLVGVAIMMQLLEVCRGLIGLLGSTRI